MVIICLKTKANRFTNVVVMNVLNSQTARQPYFMQASIVWLLRSTKGIVVNL